MDLNACILVAACLLSAFAQYSARRDGDVVRLEDGTTKTIVSVMPSRGNTASNMRVHGKKVLYTGGRGMTGIPFLAP